MDFWWLFSIIGLQLKKEIRVIIFFVLLMTMQSLVGLSGRSFFSPRSQSVDAVRDIIGWQEYINRCDTGCSYYATAATLEYARMFHPEKTAQYFFGTNTLVFSGSTYPVRDSNDILADYFGLPTDFHSIVVFTPRVRTAQLDLGWYYGNDTYVRNAYIRIHAPLVATSWAMNLCEVIQNEGSADYPAGYMAATAIPRSAQNSSVTQVLAGGRTVGDIQPIRHGLICGTHTKVAISDIQMVIGYNPVCGQGHHFGLNLRVSAPTGNHSNGHLFFEPIVGNGGHWECGVGFTGHGIFYENCQEDTQFGLYADANFTHLFSSRQRRSFDIDGAGAFSRYMLLERMAASAPGLSLGANHDPAQNQYQRSLIPAINVTTLCADIAIAVQADFAIKAAYWHGSWSVDIGYNAWARTKEYVTWRQKFPSQSFALKGDALVYGFDQVSAQFIPLNATESQATIESGQGTGNATFENMNVDNAQVAFFNGNELFVTSAAVDAVRGSDQAILLHNCDINDLSGLSPLALTHKFFVHVAYDGDAGCRFTPFVGCGASVEMDGSDRKTRSAFSQWAIWLKAGFAC
jgi:hypothetical protein